MIKEFFHKIKQLQFMPAQGNLSNLLPLILLRHTSVSFRQKQTASSQLLDPIRIKTTILPTIKKNTNHEAKTPN